MIGGTETELDRFIPTFYYMPKRGKKWQKKRGFSDPLFKGLSIDAFLVKPYRE